uniref:Uncharacterized protein n=1 Tax=Phocoena sinus TaxID=42100 RepID=A0A8C9AU32_PHOSS
KASVNKARGLPSICLKPKLDTRSGPSVSSPDALNRSREIGNFLRGNWSREAELMLLNQKIQIKTLNATRLDPVTLGDFTTWLSSAFTFFKEWIGVGMFAVCCMAGLVVCLWLICRLRTRTKRDKMLFTQALVAISKGDSPGAWISILNDP